MHSYEFFIKTDKKNIDFINKILEAYEGIANVRTIDPKKALIKIIITNYFIKDVKEIILDLKQNHFDLSIIKENKWEGTI